VEIAEILLPEVERNLTGGLTESRRFFHGRGRTFEGMEFINVDWFHPVVLVTLYREVAEEWLLNLAKQLRSALGKRCQAVMVQSRFLHGGPIKTLFGNAPDSTYALEAGLEYKLRLGSAQNVGFFLDMREGRALVRKRARGKKVLNLFSYTCSFSMAAITGGASHVVNIDMNRGALDTGRENHRHNGLDVRKASFLSHDIFKSFGKLRKLGPFDLVVIDPPTDQGKSFSATTGWPKLVSKLGGLLAPGSEVLACLNAPQLTSCFLERVFSERLPTVRLMGQFGPPSSFPEEDSERGLKILHFM